MMAYTCKGLYNDVVNPIFLVLGPEFNGLVLSYSNVIRLLCNYYNETNVRGIIE